MQSIEYTIQEILSNFHSSNYEGLVLLKKDSIVVSASLITQYEILSYTSSLTSILRLDLLKEEQLNTIIYEMLLRKNSIFTQQEYNLLENFQYYFQGQSRGSFSPNYSKQIIKNFLPSTSKTKYVLQDFSSCWENNSFFYILFKNQYKIYYKDTMQEIVLPPSLHNQVIDKMLLNGRKFFTEEAYQLIHPYILYLYQYGYYGCNCSMKEFSQDITYQEIEQFVLSNKNYFLLEKQKKTGEVFTDYSICDSQVDGTFYFDIEKQWHERLINSMFKSNSFILSYEDYKKILNYDLYKTKVKLTKRYIIEYSLFDKILIKIRELQKKQKIDDLKDLWESKNYFIVKAEQEYIIYHLASLSKLDVLLKFYSEIIQKMLANDILVVSQTMYEIIKKYKVNIR